MDVDGVLTDGTVEIHSDGTESKRFSILDGMGIVRLNKAGVAVAWISGRASGATTARATELKVPHLIPAGRTDKLMASPGAGQPARPHRGTGLLHGRRRHRRPRHRLGGRGRGAGHIDAVAALKVSDLVPGRAAGLGAVREVCEQILAHRGQ